ncbi:MAG TPA: LCP family protein [Candidatus Sulfotelmatobacter sp.]|nr:LCP family protein [Candidatus Sulfotelmatobacter sp.]
MPENPQPKRPNQPLSIDGFRASPQPRRRPTHKVEYKDDRLSQTSVDPTKVNGDMPRRSHLAKNNTDADSLLNKSIPPTRSKPKKKRSKKKIFLKVFAVILVLLVAAGAWDGWQLYHKLHHLDVKNLSASVGGAENILVAGSTNRCNLKVQNAQWGFCSQGVTGVNSDVIFIVHLVPKTHTISLLSIPRDTFIPNARSGDEAFKIDAALYQGPDQLVNAVQEDFGIPIQHYAEVGFDGFVNIVNAIGGIKMDFPMPVYDSESYLNVQTPGCKTLNGVEALQVVRARHLQYKAPGVTTNDPNYWPQENESDIARIARTHEFLRVLASTVAAQGIDNPITDQKLVDAIAPQVQVDSGLSTGEMISLLQEFHAVGINSVPQYTLPIVTTNFGNYVYQDNSYGDVVFPIEAEDQQIIDKFLGTNSSIDTLTGKPLPKPSSVSVNVVNGSGTPDQAGQATSSLQSLGFNMVGTPGTATPVSQEAQETVVYYSGRSTEADALAVAKDLNGYVILAQDPSRVTRGSQITVLTGTDMSVNTPTSPSSSSTQGSATSPSSTSSSSSSSSSSGQQTVGIGTVSSATQGLSPWDPRACTK